jgi:hypothetical protein
MKLLPSLLFAAALQGAQYYISPTGSDSNNGTSTGTPWLTPNHALNCGDVVTAAAGTYTYSNFGATSWGTVTCTAGNNVAWLACVTFDACVITTNGTVNGMVPNSSYWGVQGWQFNMTGSPTSTGGSAIAPAANCTAIVHHQVFANNVINGAGVNGIGTGVFPITSGCGDDYIAIIGNITYFASQWTGNCNSGISFYAPLAYDTNAGTHLYAAGNFSYGNVNNCSSKTDGEGLILDDFNQSQGGSPVVYAQQTVIENNILLYNAGPAFKVFNNNSAPVVFRYNTTYGDASGSSEAAGDCAEVYIQTSNDVTIQSNLIATAAATGCSGSVALYGISSGSGTGMTVSSNWIYSAAGNNCTGTCGSNTTGTSPNFVSTTQPGAPSCSSATSVPNCMATVIANFTPQAGGASTYGYQVPTTTYSSNAYFPAWLCNVNLPAGLVSNFCNATSYTGSALAGGAITGGTIH